MAAKRVSVQLTDEALYEWFRGTAEVTGRSVVEVLQEAMRIYRHGQGRGEGVTAPTGVEGLPPPAVRAVPDRPVEPPRAETRRPVPAGPTPVAGGKRCRRCGHEEGQHFLRGCYGPCLCSSARYLPPREAA
jgi:hypothetical protein